MNVLQSLALGAIQGLTEFLPVSSTAHLILAPQILGIPTPRAEIAHTYDTLIQAGTVLPVLIYFWKDWLRLAAAAVRVLRARSAGSDLDEKMLGYLILGSIPAGVLGLLLEKRIERLAQPAEWPPAYLCIGGALIGVGLLMLLAEKLRSQTRSIEHLSVMDAVVVGLAQATALFPGVSRSGSTITAGLMTGLSREAAARFSFLLMTPIMLLATGYKCLKVLRGAEPMSPEEWQGTMLAAGVAAVTGYAAIAVLLRWLRTRSLGFFVGWRILVGAFAIGLYFAQK